MPEEHVIGIWLGELHPERRFTAHGGQEVRVLAAGRRNRHDGPDFLDATVVIDGALRRGSIEVHVREGDWRRHRHHLNERYDDVVLHVCLYAEGRPAGGRPAGGGPRAGGGLRAAGGPRVGGGPRAGGPPLLVLATQMQEPLRRAWARARQPRSPLRCRSAAVRPDPHHAEAMIALAAAERFERKCARLEARWEQLAADMTDAGAFRQMVYEAFARAAGYGGNEDAFERLAQSVPLKVLAAARASARQEMLIGGARGEPPAAANRHVVAGRPAAGGESAAVVDEKLHIHDWHASGVLPGNRPAPRMRWLADWAPQLERPAWWRALFAVFEGDLAARDSFAPLFASRVRTGRPGPERQYELAVNVLAPAVHLYARARGHGRLAAAAASLFFQLAPAPENRHTRVVARALELRCDSALRQQGMIELYTGFCTRSRCGECLLGIRGGV